MKKMLAQQWWLIALAIVIFILTLLYSSSQIAAQAERPMPVKTETIQHPSVSVITVTPQRYTAKVTGYGELTPHFDLTLSSQVSGQIIDISPSFEVGKVVNKGDWLVKLEQSDYQAAVKLAEKDLASAKLALLEQQRQAIQAKSEWLASGIKGQPDSELVLRAPQLAEAKSDVESAESALKSAQKDLAQTIIKAPFDAVITHRSVALGTYIQSGNTVASLNSTDRLEVAVPLSNKDWLTLTGEDLSSHAVTLTNVETNQSWAGRVLRAQQHVDPETRQRAVIVAIDKPLTQNQAAYAGMFVSMSLEANAVDNLWKLPSSALSQRGEVWYVTADNTLDKFDTSPVFSRDGAIFISPPAELSSQQQAVVTHPLNNYLQGMMVAPEWEQTNVK